MAVFRAVERRRAGITSPASAADCLRSTRLSRLDLNVEVEIKSPHHGPITWLDVDSAEERYLLTGGADCTIAVFDLDGAGHKKPLSLSDDIAPRRSAGGAAGGTASRTGSRRQQARELRQVGRTRRAPIAQRGSSYGGHQYSVSVVQWYPVDTGLFVSGAMDGVVKLWDTNTLEVVLEFDFQEKVFAAAMSAAPGQNHLIAVGNDSPQARLCDIRSGAFSHSLTGHSEAVWACAWSPRSEYLLATGSADQTARLWDIRRSGASACLISLDQHQEEEGEEEEEEGRGGVRGSGGLARRGTRNVSGGGGGGGDGSVRSIERGYMKHRKLAPHASRASKFARAHAGPVNSLCFTPDGLHVLTAGTDNRLRLWQVETGHNTMMNYLETKNRRRRPFGMAVVQPAGRKSETVFFPNDKSGDVLMFPLHTVDGRSKGQLRAHFDPVQCCAYRPRTQELVTCGADGLVLLWSAAAPPWTPRASYLPSTFESGAAGGVKRRRLGQIYAEDQDMWSSDDNDDDDGGRGGVRGSSSLETPAAVAGGGRGGGSGGDGSGSRGGGGGGSGSGRGGFVPPILMQQRRKTPGPGGR